MKFTVCFATTLLALCLVLQSSSATYGSGLMLSGELPAIIKDLQSAIEILKNSMKAMGEAEVEALMQIGPDDVDVDDGEANIQQRSLSQLLQLQLALRDLIRAIARLERSIRWERRG